MVSLTSDLFTTYTQGRVAYNFSKVKLFFPKQTQGRTRGGGGYRGWNNPPQMSGNNYF